MKVVISRGYTPFQTVGRMVVFAEDKDIFKCFTLELPDNGNQKRVSCIPEGEYRVTKIFSPRHGKCFEVHDVPDRTAILIHKGNYKEDTEGCILVGNCLEDINLDGNYDVVNSTDTLNKLLLLLPNEFTLYII